MECACIDIFPIFRKRKKAILWHLERQIRCIERNRIHGGKSQKDGHGKIAFGATRKEKENNIPTSKKDKDLEFKTKREEINKKHKETD
jgi:hypothetical protein